jgi:hypothetical protein
MHICSRVQFVKVRQEFRIVKVGVVGILRGPALCVIAEVQAESRHNLLLPLVEDGCRLELVLKADELSLAIHLRLRRDLRAPPIAPTLICPGFQSAEGV